MDSKDLKMNLRFEVADVKKPLIAVKRICEKGNLVSFGPKEGINLSRTKTRGIKY